jgi:hypothetical protein
VASRPHEPADALSDIAEIVLARRHWATIVAHGRRKLDGRYLEDETPVRQAFGLLGGRPSGDRIDITHVFPLRINLREDPVHGADVDEAVRELAIPSSTPIGQRGWLASPDEVMEAQASCDAEGATLFGTYHMHKTAWRADPLRDTPTALDAALATKQGLWTLVLSLVDPERPILRAFWESLRDNEAAIIVDDDVGPHRRGDDVVRGRRHGEP